MNNYDKAYKFAMEEIGDFKYFDLSLLAGFIVVVGYHKNCGINQDTIDACKNALLDRFDGGCEHEWEKESHWKYWEAISPEWFKTEPYTKYNGDIDCRHIVSKTIKDFE